MELPIPQPRFSEHSPELALLAAIHDRLGLVVNATVRNWSKDTLKFEPYPRPVSAMERARARHIERTRELFIQRLKALQTEG